MNDMTGPPRTRPSGTQVILVAGVAGSGKTTIGRSLAGHLGWEYAEADDFHPAANVAKMAAGTPLTDADRLPWLRSIAAWMDNRIASGKPGVVTCSALKRAYRELLTGDRPGVRIVMLQGDRDQIAARIRARKGHFFGAPLLDSQFAELEPPSPAEGVLTVSVNGPPEEIASHILNALEIRPGKT